MKHFPILTLFDVYESLHQIIVIGSDCDQSSFKILKLAKWNTEEKPTYCSEWFLNIIQDTYTYNYDDIMTVKASLISMTSAKLIMENAYGIIGFVRFKQGYYMNLITKRSQVAQLGQHKIYKVDETKMIYLPGNTVSPWDSVTKTATDNYFPQTKHPDEKRYLALFNSVDLSIDNYFSYTYDLSNSVQYNLSYSATTNDKNKHLFNNIHEQQLLVNDRFVWNWSLWPPELKPKAGRLDIGCSWLVTIINGYVGQSCILAGAGCLDVIVCLIARRSRHFAGTRFMKRGSNLNGNVANEVESEQIVYESEGIAFEKSKVTSLIQLRGSIPLQWKQETTKSIGKPPIEMTTEDAYYDVFGKHFANLIYRYGTPIIILNLVKQREKHLFEEPLSKKFVEAINYLKSTFKYFDMDNEILKYIDFDMARIQRSKYKTVLVKMAPIAEECIQKSGFFHSDALLTSVPDAGRLLTKTLQCGLVRTNCIDCLDRTNTAQFVIGQAALGYQLYVLGVLNTYHISNIRSLDKMLQALYENHGNVLALQYGGSELVHNVETYRKTAKFSTQSRDFLQTLSRYYNNKFSDHEKQMSINLFLGIFKPWQSSNESIWNHKSSDVFLHDKYCRLFMDHQRSSSIWLTIDIISVIPKPLVIWEKWKILNQLYEYASSFDFTFDLEKRISILSNYSNMEPIDSKFNRSYTHLIDIILTNRTVIDFFYSINVKNNLLVEINDTKNQYVVDSERLNQMDSIDTLTSGPVMTALRNEKFSETKSVSSESLSDATDNDLTRQDQVNTNNCSTLPNGHETDKNKYINFVITDYAKLSTNINDCINSSWNFYLANNKFNITTAKVIGIYNPNSSYDIRPLVCQMYKETINFNRTGKRNSTNMVFHCKYLTCKDFSKNSVQIIPN